MLGGEEKMRFAEDIMLVVCIGIVGVVALNFIFDLFAYAVAIGWFLS